MGNFNRGEKGNKGDRFGEKKRFDKGRGFRRDGGRSDRPSMHSAICAECGKECEVPFKPTGDKPVFCSNCFGKRESSSNRFKKRDSERLSFDKPMFEAVCDKCQQVCEVPFKPSGDKPVFCSDCFSKGERSGKGGASANRSDRYKDQFEMINIKLDNILKMLSPEKRIEKADKAEKNNKRTVEKIEKKNNKKVEPSKKKAFPKKSVKKIDKKKKK